MEIEIKNAVICEAQIGFASKEKITAWIITNDGMAKQGFGGVDLTNDNLAAKFLMQVFRVVGVGTLEQLLTKPVRIRRDKTKIYYLGNYVSDVWLNVDTLELSTLDGRPILPIPDEPPAAELPPTVSVDSDGKKHYGIPAEPGKMGAKLS